MPGLSDTQLYNLLADIGGTGNIPAWNLGSGGTASSSSRWLALFTTAPTGNSGTLTGATEVPTTGGTNYSRVQFAGQLQVASSGGVSGSAITLSATAPAWVTALGTSGSGLSVFDVTSGYPVPGTVSSISGTTVTMSTSVSHVSNSDYLQFSIFPIAQASSGSEPAVTPGYVASNASVTFPQSSANWGYVTSWGVMDASSGSTYLRAWDWIGNYKWYPFVCTQASPGVFTNYDYSPASNSYIVVTAKEGSTMPTTSGSWVGPLVVTNISSSTFSAGVNTTSTGDGLFREIIGTSPNAGQNIPINSTFSLASGNITIVGF